MLLFFYSRIYILDSRFLGCRIQGRPPAFAGVIDKGGGGDKKRGVWVATKWGMGDEKGARLELVQTVTNDAGIRITGSGTRRIDFVPNLGAGGWNPLSQAGDFGLIFTEGTSGTGNFVIGPWSASAHGIRITAAGNVGIGTVSPGQRLQVGAAGDGTTAVGNAWNVFSDIRLKTNIEEIQNALGIVSGLRGIQFDWAKSKENSIGFIAQEVEETLPQVVSADASGYKSVDYSKITSVLVEAIKEQQGQIEELREANKNLKLENEMIIKRIEILEAK